MESNKLLPRDRLLLGYETSTWMKLHFTEYIQKKRSELPLLSEHKVWFFFFVVQQIQAEKYWQRMKVKRNTQDGRVEKRPAKHKANRTEIVTLVWNRNNWWKVRIECKRKNPKYKWWTWDSITFNACQARLVKLNYFDYSEVRSFKKKLYVELRFC